MCMIFSSWVRSPVKFFIPVDIVAHYFLTQAKKRGITTVIPRLTECEAYCYAFFRVQVYWLNPDSILVAFCAGFQFPDTSACSPPSAGIRFILPVSCKFFSIYTAGLERIFRACLDTVKFAVVTVLGFTFAG